MKEVKKVKKAVSILIAAAFVFMLSITSFAQQGQHLVIDYSTEDGALNDAEFSLYRLGDVKNGRIIPTEAFDVYSVSFDISDSEKLSSLALTLSAYAQRDKVTPDYKDSTDENGKADFENISLPDGAYLYIGKKHIQNGNIYFCDSAIIILPYGDGDSVTVNPKYESLPEDSVDIYISHKVLKGWYADDINNRPSYIEVQLLRDGEIYDTVILNSDNNWRYQWKDLPAGYQWLVTEKRVSAGYVVSLSENEKTFLLKNSVYNEEQSTNTIESTTAPETTTEPDSTTDVVTTKPNGGTPDLPQTGALKWPVPYLACIGVILLIAGYATKRKSEIDGEQE